MIYTLGLVFIRGIAWLDFILATLILYILSYLPKKCLGYFYDPLFRHWCFIFIKALGVNLNLHQKNKLPLPKRYILIGNHPSALEDIGMLALFKVYFLAKEELKDWYILGRISMAAGTLYVKRDDKNSRRKAKEDLKAYLTEGKNVGLYPEGGCKGRRIFLPFQFGCFDLALKMNIPIVPVFLHYEAQENFEWQKNENLIQKLIKIVFSINKNAHYYVFDAIDPTLFKDKESLCQHTENLYIEWQKKYLE